MEMGSLISIITVTYKDAWAFTKTARSLFCQEYNDFEYIVIDGDSNDGTQALVNFWKDQNLIDKSICEPDKGVYEAMNKGAAMASGKYVCFMNAGDVFADNETLARVSTLLENENLDGCLGWGELGGKIWASWNESAAFKMSSLGFCHQALFVKRDLILEHPFDDRSFKTDSDTLQLGQLYEAGANIPVVPQVWALRGGEPGISADLERSQKSIMNTLTSEYRELTSEDAEKLLSFRRRCDHSDFVIQLMVTAKNPMKFHVACMVLDTLYQRQSKVLSDEELDVLQNAAILALESHYGIETNIQLDRLIKAQNLRKDMMAESAISKDNLNKDIWTFRDQEKARIEKLGKPNKKPQQASSTEYIISLTSFPKRIQTLSYVIQSLVNQSHPPKEIHLNIGMDEIPHKTWLPSALLAFEEQGLKINFSPKTSHQYDKYLHNYALNEQYPFVIVDDDVIYPAESMETLIKGHETYPEAVVANRAHFIKADVNGVLAPYSEWKREVNAPHPSLRLMPTGAGGVLYPKGFLLNDIITDVTKVLQYAPYADDIWLKFCALALGIPTYATKLSEGSKWYHRYTPTMRAGTLMAANVDRGLNDLQIQVCAKWLSDYRPQWVSEFIEDNQEVT